MIRNNYSLIAVAILLILLLAGAGCFSTSSISPQPAAGAPQKTYLVGIDGHYQPFSYIDSSGTATGFDVDAMRWIAQKKGMNVTFLPIAWDDIVPALLADKIDLIYSGMTITTERTEQVNFSTPYWVVNLDVVTRNGTATTFDDVLSGKTIIGTQSGCTAATWIERNLIETGKMPKENLKLYNNTPLAVSDLEVGRIDAVMYDDLVLKEIIRGKVLHVAGNVETKEVYGIAVRKSDPELLATLNDGLAQLKNDPYWQELIVRYKMK